MNYVVATIKSWNIENFKSLKKGDKVNNWFLITNKEELSLKNLDKIKPRYIFFPHWSWIIPNDIFKKYECVVFHMTDLPYGRGGSPLQNLIVRGHKATKLSAIRVVEGLDAGPVYFKKDLDLSGTAEDIYKRASILSYAGIREIVNNNLIPLEQNGKVIKFDRRKSSESDVSNLNSIEEVYNYIRMLDAEGYPRAFLEKNNLRFEFEKAKLIKGKLTSKVNISVINNKYEK